MTSYVWANSQRDMLNKMDFGPFEETIEQITGNHGSFIRVVQLKADRSEAVFSMEKVEHLSLM